MKPALSLVCSLPSELEQNIVDYAAGACQTVELWLGKVEGWLENHTVDDLRRVLRDNGVVAPVASYQGGLLVSQGDARREHWNHFARRLELCRQLEVGTLVVAGDLIGPLNEQDLERAIMSLRQAGGQAGQAGVRLALEFQSQASFGNNLQTAAAIVEQVGEPNVGLCLDLFHYYCGPSKPEDLGLLSNDNLFHAQFCDLSGTPRELATDGDRILPGDGDFLLEPIVALLREIGYDGCVAVEAMNPIIWQIPPRQFGEVAMTALRKALGQAGME